MSAEVGHTIFLHQAVTTFLPIKCIITCLGGKNFSLSRISFCSTSTLTADWELGSSDWLTSLEIWLMVAFYRFSWTLGERVARGCGEGWFVLWGWVRLGKGGLEHGGGVNQLGSPGILCIHGWGWISVMQVSCTSKENAKTLKRLYLFFIPTWSRQNRN